MRKPAVLAWMALLTVSLAVLVWSAKTSGDTVRPVQSPQFGAALDRAAAAAQGRRILVVEMRPGVAPTSSIFESSRGATGWGAFPPTPTASDPLLPALKSLGDAAATELARDKAISAPTLRALTVFEVAVVLCGDGTSVVVPDVGERDPGIGVASEVPALRVRKADPVYLFLAEQPGTGPADALGFVRTLRFGDADFRDDEDHAPWGGDMTIVAGREAEYLIPWTSAGARVTVDGEPATFRAARVPVLIVKVSPGRHRVSVRYGDEGMPRQWATIGAALAVVVSFIALWLGLRPTPKAPTEAPTA